MGIEAAGNDDMKQTDDSNHKRKISKKQPESKGNKKLKVILTVLLIVVIAGILTARNIIPILKFFGIGDELALNSYLYENKKFQKLTIKATLYEELSTGAVFGEVNSLNILVFGLDKDASRTNQYDIFRPDTIILASINFDKSAISVISIPRDSYVEIAGFGVDDKINSCFYYGGRNKKNKEEAFKGGLKCLKDTVSDLTGVAVNYYMGVDMDGVVGIVDTIGGVEVDVHENVYYKGSLMVRKGLKVLSGKEFLAYARNRNYATADIKRTEIQQKLIKALFKQAVNPSNIMKVPQLITQVNEMLSTDMNFDQMSAIGFKLAEFDLGNIKTGTIPGSFSGPNWGVKASEVRKYVADMLK